MIWGNLVFQRNTRGSWKNLSKEETNKGGFQLLDLILPELKSHVIPYKFKSSHWLRANLVKDFFFTNEVSTNEST